MRKRGGTVVRSIRAKFTRLIVCAIVVAMFIATLIAAFAIRSIGTSKSEQALLLLAQTSQKNLNTYFGSVEQSVETVSSFVHEDLKGLEPERLAEHVEHMRTIFGQTANNTVGALTYYYRIDPAVSDTVKGFWYTNLDGKGFQEHEVTDISLYDTEDTSKLVWFTVPKSTGEAFWLPSYITDNLDVRVISYNAPIYWNNRFIGVVGIELDYRSMAEQVDNIKLYSNGYAFINDYEGNIVYHPHIDVLAMNKEDIPKTPENLLNEGTILHYSFEGVDKEGVWLPLRNGTRLNVVVPVSEINGDWLRIIYIIVAVSAVLLIIFVLLALHLTGTITKPLQDITNAAREVNNGNYDISLTYQKNDEVGILTRAINNLIMHLKTYIRDLNDLAYGDALTAVRNKGAFDLFIQDIQEKIDNHEGPTEFAVCFFDCNDLKVINDTYGHDKGDIYLKTACTLICKVFAHSPVFRIGGDEFAAILRNHDYENREKLISVFDQRCFDLRAIGREPWEQVSVARGIAEYDPSVDKTVQDVVHRADAYMYENKKKKR